MSLALAVGGLSVALLVLVARWWRSAPSRAHCPRCAEPTHRVQAPVGGEFTKGVVERRFCTGCGWHGLGKAGPEWRPGHPSAHGSGFHWGDERTPADFGFQWSDDGTPTSPAEPLPPPDHPSGFRFSPEEDESSLGWTFRWADEVESEAEEADTDASRPGPRTEADHLRRGFRWGSRDPSPGGPGFRWKDDRRG